MTLRNIALLLTIVSAYGVRSEDRGRRSLLQLQDGPQASVGILPALPYETTALEPRIDNATTTLHWARHLNTYVVNLRYLVGNNSQLEGLSLAELQDVAGTDALNSTAATTLINNGGGSWNHAFFFKELTPPGTNQSNYNISASDELKDAINDQFGNFSVFQKNFTAAATGVFGSGWAWLIVGDDGLEITTTPNQNNPLMTNLANTTKTTAGIPVLGLDVWEHAYYLKHQNVRADYITDFFFVINWAQISENYQYAAAGAVPNTAPGPILTHFTPIITA